MRPVSLTFQSQYYSNGQGIHCYCNNDSVKTEDNMGSTQMPLFSDALQQQTPKLLLEFLLGPEIIAVTTLLLSAVHSTWVQAGIAPGVEMINKQLEYG